MKRTEFVDKIRQEVHKMSPRAQTILYGAEAQGDARSEDINLLMDTDKLTYNDKDYIIILFYGIEIETDFVIPP